MFIYVSFIQNYVELFISLLCLSTPWDKHNLLLLRLLTLNQMIVSSQVHVIYCLYIFILYVTPISYILQLFQGVGKILGFIIFYTL